MGLLAGSIMVWITELNNHDNESPEIFVRLCQMRRVLIVYVRLCLNRPAVASCNMWGFVFQAWHFPFVLLLFAIVIGNSPVLDILGIVVGHLYYFLSDVVPRVYNYQILKTPEFMYRFLETNPAARAAAARPWMRGQGHRLGD